MAAHVFDKRARAFCSLLVKGEHPDIPHGKTDRNREIAKLYTQDGWTQWRIAERYGLTQARVSQILAEGGIDGGHVPVTKIMARIIGCSEDSISAWRHGRRAIPGYVWRLLNALSAVAEMGGVDAVRWAVMDTGRGEDTDIDYEIPEHRKIAGLRA